MMTISPHMDAPHNYLRIQALVNRYPSLVNFALTEKFPNLPQYRELQPPTIEVIGDLAHM
jgi:hypothetical protein